MRIIRAKDYADVSRKAANIIASVVQLKPDCVLGLATGSCRVGTFQELIAKYQAGDLDFSKVSTVNLTSMWAWIRTTTRATHTSCVTTCSTM